MADSIKSEQLLDQCVKEAMFFDIQKFLGQTLFYEVALEVDENDISALNLTLLNGGEYTYSDYTYYFQGLKACLAYYAFARYTKRTGVHYTQTGVVTKSDDYSEPVSDKTRSRMANDDYALAEGLRLEIIDYLNRNYTDYPLWTCATKKRTTFRAIGL